MNYLEYLATKTFLLNELEKLENNMKKDKKINRFLLYYVFSIFRII